MNQLVLFMIMLNGLCIMARSSERIVCGNNAENVVPFHAHITFWRDKIPYFGSGALISSRAVITVAQNIYGYSDWEVGLGSKYFELLEWVTFIEKSVTHPNYDPVLLRNNIGLLFFKPIEFTDVIHPMRLPLSSWHVIIENFTGTVSGFGIDTTGSASEILQIATQTLLSQNDCGQAYPFLVSNEMLEDHFCATDLINQSNINQGDQGSPFELVILQHVLFGLASFTKLPVHPNNYPAVYVRITSYLNWINTELNKR